jgi:oligo-1,6-glucosidase
VVEGPAFGTADVADGAVTLAGWDFAILTVSGF